MRQFLYRVIVVLAACLMVCAAQGAVPQDTVKGQKPRYTVRRTTTETVDDVKHRSTDLRDPANLKTEVTYDEKDGTYSIGTVLESQKGKNRDKKDKNKKAYKEVVKAYQTEKTKQLYKKYYGSKQVAAWDAKF